MLPLTQVIINKTNCLKSIVYKMLINNRINVFNYVVNYVVKYVVYFFLQILYPFP